MKQIFITTGIIFAWAAGLYSQSFYDINTINTIEITFEESNWDYLLDQLVSAGQEERLMGSVTINDVAYDSVGVRYKGNSSYTPNQVKNPLNIKLDYIIEDQDIEGYGTLKLANVFKDPSFVREVLSYEIARKYFPASLANYANVYINGTHLGLYTSDQDVDKFFSRTHFGSDESTRIKGESSGPSGGVWEYYGQDSSSYYSKYTLESDMGWQDLIDFLDTLNNHNEKVEQVLNIDRHLWFLAFSNLFVNLDGPINNPQNYYIFKDNAGRFNPIPWDLNECFGVFRMHQTLGNLGTTQMQQFSPFANLNESDFPIISKILTNNTYRKIYVAHMKTIMQENIENGWYETRALEIQDIIDEAVQADNNKFYTYADFLNNINNSVGGGPPPNQQIIGITQLMESRVNYISGLSDFTAQAPEISNVAFNPEFVTPNTEVWFHAEVDETDQVYLVYRNSLLEVFEKTEMFDDGNHQDGAANDGVYGVSLMAGNSNIQYYIYAENEDASAFSPVRAEYEFYHVYISSDLVINEFMADNESTVADQDGEYDDWIEFYNNSTEEISLLGYFLSDDLADLTQWAFPDTTIAPDDYLIVWADNDEEQEGLHANFKLSSSGESILLTIAGLDIIDEVSFGQQYADTTTGRFPNGTGEFVLMPPTFGMYNDSGFTAIQEQGNNNILSLSVFPNPFNNKVTVEFYLENPEEVSVQFHNVYGQTVHGLSSQYFEEGKQSVTVNTSYLSPGVWICNLVAGGKPHSLKLVKY
jgi:spore coat protein CotH